MAAKKAKNGKQIWPVYVLDKTRYRASVIAAMFNLTIGDVLDNALVCYSNTLRLNDKLEQEFPRDGLEKPPKSENPRRPPNLRKFQEHAEFWANRKNSGDPQ